MYTICGPILTSFFFEMTINPKRLPNRPRMIIAGARYVDEKVFKLNLADRIRISNLPKNEPNSN